MNNATSTYAYDASGQRIKQTSGGVTTVYPTKYYNTDGTTPTKHIFANGELIATIVGTGATTTVYSIATDHLTGSNVSIGDDGTVTELTDYYPYGSSRLDEQSGSFNEARKFTGQIFDGGTGLYYMNSRYQNPTTGRFISQDPIFLLVGDNSFANKWNNNWRNTPSDGPDNNSWYPGKDNDNRAALQQYLSNPQHLNSYSYVMDNPLKYTDPTGEWEVHISPVIPSINFGLGGEGGNSWSIGFASDGTFGISSSVHGGGLAGVDASINWTAGYSNANTWSDTLGTGEYTSVGGKIGVGGSISTNYSDGKYTGTDVTVGLGARGLPEVPVAFSGGINNRQTRGQVYILDKIYLS